MKSTYLSLAAASILTLFITSACHKNDDGILDITFPAAFVVNGETSNLSVINLSNDEKVGVIDLGGAKFPHHVYMSPDQSLIAVAITSTDLSAGHAGHGGAISSYKVIIIDAKTGEIHHSISLEKLPHNAVFSPNGQELWVGQSDASQSKILVFNTSDFTQKVSILLGKGLSEITFSTDGTKVFAANTDDNTITVIDPTNKKVLSTIGVDSAPVGAWPATNGKMYADNETSQTVSEIDVASEKITATINLGFKPGYVAYSDHHQELWVSDATNGKVVYYKLVNGVWAKQGDVTTGADAHAIAFLKDGTKAYVTNQGANTLSVISMDKHIKIKDIPVGTKPNGIIINLPK